MDHIYEEKTENGLTLRIFQDEDAQNPCKEYEDPAVMVCWHSRYQLGHDKKKWAQPWDDPQEFLEWARKERVAFLPLYLYDHSGITMSTDAFSCPWDSGQVGFIYWDKKEAKKCGCVGWKRKRKEESMRAQVAVYDQYLTGDVYGYTIEDEKGEHLDSCWGFFGLDYAKEEARSALQYQVNDRVKKASLAVL